MKKIEIIICGITAGLCLGELICRFNEIPTVGCWLLLLLLEFSLQIIYNLIKQN